MKKNNKEIKVSIIIPVYNVAAYVEECIQSVLNQDYEDMEVIIVDDCGTDNSMELVWKTITGTTRTVYILEHKYNKGLPAARNTGIRQATGDYIFFLDSDDWIEPYCISSLVIEAQRYPNAEILVGSTKAVPERYCLDDILNRTDLKEYYDDRKVIKKLMLDTTRYPFGVWNKLIKLEWLLKHNLLMREGFMHELNWTFYAAKYTSCIVFYKKITHYYRYNPNGICSTTSIQKWAESMYIVVKDMICHIDIHCLFSQLRIIRIYGNHALHLLHKCYILKYGGGNRPIFIKMFYPLVYLPMLIFNKNKLFR